MKETRLDRLAERYLKALRSYLAHEPGGDPGSARGLGRRAVHLDLGTLDLAKIHRVALAVLLEAGGGDSRQEESTARAAEFFAEANTAIEKTHRLAIKTGADLDELNLTLVQRTNELADSNRLLQCGIDLRMEAVESLRASEAESARLLTEARELQTHLQDLARRILSAQEEERKAMSLTLRDDIAQTLLGIKLRLLALDTDLSVSTETFKKEIAITQELVQQSVKTIDRFAREFGHSL